MAMMDEIKKRNRGNAIIKIWNLSNNFLNYLNFIDNVIKPTFDHQNITCYSGVDVDVFYDVLKEKKEISKLTNTDYKKACAIVLYDPNIPVSELESTVRHIASEFEGVIKAFSSLDDMRKYDDGTGFITRKTIESMIRVHENSSFGNQ